MNQKKVNLLFFSILEYEFALSIHTVVEILKIDKISPLVKAPKFIEGVINYQDRIIPVLNTRKILNITNKPYPVSNSYLIIVLLQKTILGLLVDKVEGVVEVPLHKIELPEGLLSSQLENSFVIGIIKNDQRLIYILNLFNMISSESLKQNLNYLYKFLSDNIKKNKNNKFNKENLFHLFTLVKNFKKELKTIHHDTQKNINSI